MTQYINQFYYAKIVRIVRMIVDVLMNDEFKDQKPFRYNEKTNAYLIVWFLISLPILPIS